MTLRMADGPVANLPLFGMDAYAGYVNHSGIGPPTYPAVVELCKTTNKIPFSITTNGSIAQCADVERGAMMNWHGYDYGYCSVSNVNSFITLYGRPRKLWTAHYDPTLGAHICSPQCWPGLSTTADGTQWTNHGSADYDESLLSDDFFSLTPNPPLPNPTEDNVAEWQENGQNHLAAVIGDKAYHWYQQQGGNPAPAPAWHCEVLPLTAQ